MRMDVSPSCFITYSKATDPDAPTDNHNLLVSGGNLINVYDGSRLVWAAKCDSEPIALRVLNRG